MFARVEGRDYVRRPGGTSTYTLSITAKEADDGTFQLDADGAWKFTGEGRWEDDNFVFSQVFESQQPPPPPPRPPPNLGPPPP